ncbi:hypothetical protein LJR034_008654 [Caballeronia sp. LjRoot34]|uniref:hypothetical protein n=1 Tax=Caballeronia sp. LjRoot34 TaxID=3342325 RepID=UPI003ED03484
MLRKRKKRAEARQVDCPPFGAQTKKNRIPSRDAASFFCAAFAPLNQLLNANRVRDHASAHYGLTTLRKQQWTRQVQM